jgi:uncharacterized protein (TIGR02453 family)
VRFSKDKSPYKTNYGAFIANGGRKSKYAGYYIHLEDGKSMIGGGIYMPATEVVKKVRNEIYYNVDEFKALLSDSNFLKYFSGLEDFDKLKRPPKDFPADFEHIDLLKYKSYAVMHSLTNEIVTRVNFIEYILEVLNAMKPLNDFINRAIDN